ncbi:filamentous hemagglutinin family N-terminal domain protein [Lysobacter antibioticus]|uniref:two-partner secretion domain-containing protein n=1 Tax=Lysobacter antibioticus TaxID=84531 RepID=UPI0007172E78|nr:hemagglutinin repeat-containing protein [Lysobacter antibioticus]ALN65272.1 filamentous hemagglutinin family N-terminal domain protein [Lysobacter antibioticus]
MNRIYRLVFNCALGVWQVASELVRSPSGGSAGGGRAAAPGLRSMTCALWIAMGFATTLPAFAQVVADPNAPGNQRPTVLQAPNGVPLVNIQTPSAAGVSRNTYSQFDVNREGAILNNSRSNVQTQLGGWVQGNPWLAGGGARVILNEVNSANPSHLNGYVEVAGPRAEVVIANPAGIQVDGGGFINTSRATLTTGAPMLASGNLDGYRVEAGAIRIGGAGLDASATDYTDLIARSLEVNAGVWAQQLRVTAGANTVSADHASIVAGQGGGATPAFALDVGALGGMYAGKIALIGTEHGLGVRNAGAIGAQAGELTLSADGRLSNSGQIQAQSNAAFDLSGGVANAGTISAGQELRIGTAQDLDNSGGTLNARRLDLSAQSLVNREGSIEQTGLQALRLDAGALSNRDGGRIGLAELSAGGGGSTGSGGTGAGGGSGTAPPSDPSAPTVAPPPVVPLADGVLRIGGLLNNDAGAIVAASGIALNTNSGLNNDGGELGLASLTVAAGDLSNRGGTLAVQGGAQLQLGTLANDAGRLSVGGALGLNAQTFSNRSGELLHGGSDAVHWQVAGLLDNSYGRLATNAAQFQLDAGSLINEQGRIEHAGSAGMGLNTGDLRGPGGQIATAGALQLTAGVVDHRGATLSANSLNVAASQFDNRGGTIQSGAAGSFTVASRLDNDGGKVATQGDLSIVTDSLGNAGGTLHSAGSGTTSIQAGSVQGAGGTIGSNGSLLLRGQNVDLSAGTTFARSVDIVVDTLSTARGSLQSASSLAIAASSTLDNAGGRIASNGDTTLSTALLDNQAGTIEHAGTGTLAIQAATLNGAGGTIGGNGVLDLRGGAVDLSGGQTYARQIGIQAGALNHAGGTMQAGDTATLSIRDSLDNNQGRIAASGDTRVQATTLLNRGGTIEHAGTGTLAVQAVAIDGAGGKIASNGQLNIDAQSVDLRGGDTYGQRVDLQAVDLITAGGKLSAGESALLDVQATLDNAAGRIASGGDLQVQAGNLGNQAGLIASTTAMQVTTGALDNRQGQIQSGATAALSVAGALDNSAGSIVAQQALGIAAASLDNDSGVLASIDDAVALDIAGAFSNIGGRIQSGTAINLNSQGLDNSGGDIAGATVAIDAGNGALDNDGGRIAGAQTLRIDSGALSNDAGLIHAGTALAIDTRGQALNNANSGSDKGISSGGILQVSAGALSNSAGTVYAGGAATLQATSIVNRGQIGGRDTLTLTAGGIDNRGGQIQALGDTRLDAGAGLIDNQTGLIGSAAQLSLSAASLDNRNTLGANQGVVGGNVTVSADSVDNSAGVLSADQTLLLQGSGAVANVGGQISAGGTVDIRDAGNTRTLDNNGGSIAAGELLTLQLKRLDGIGSLQSGLDATIALVDGFDHQGTILANRDLSLSTQGDLRNAGKIGAGGDLALSANALDNTASGEISAAGGSAHISVATTVTNRGLIDSADTRIDAARIDNLGTGRLYGDHLALGAGEINNLEETIAGVTRAGTIAARERLDIGAGVLNNRREGLIYSGGDAAIGGALDGAGLATGTANAVNNTSAIIDVAGALSIDATAIANVRENVSITQSTATRAPVRLDQPQWRNNGSNATLDIRSSSNYTAYEVYYLDPNDILSDTPYITPDGVMLRKAVVRLTAQTSAYYFARGGMYAALGERSRLGGVDGTVTIYYIGRQDAQSNPDQGGSDDPFAELSQPQPGSPGFVYQSDNLAYSNAYGTCTSNCVQLWTSYDYDDPDHTLLVPQGTGGGSLGDNEEYRIATQTVTEDTIAPGIGSDAVIRSGGAMSLRVDDLTNRYGQIAAGGDLSITGHGGASQVTNIGQTLYRSYDFNNVSHGYNGTTRAWSNPSLSEQIGQLGGSITSNGTLTIDTGDLSNLNLGRNAPGVVDPSVLLNLNAGSASNAGGGSSFVLQPGAAAIEVAASPASNASGASGGAVAGGAANAPATIRTLPANFGLPSSSLFRLTLNGGGYLVETDSRFANYRNWLGSDYLLGLLGADPANQHKRLGDGYYEQRLVRDQIAQLTGRRFLDGYASDEDQFRALMNSGALFAQQFGLRPGIALTAAQMAQLTSDIVWLVEQTVTLPDGTRTTVLAPQVYVRVRNGDLHRDGTLLAGDATRLKLQGDLVNGGRIAGRTAVAITAQNISNLGGLIQGGDVAVRAQRDLINRGGVIQGTDRLVVSAGRDLIVEGTKDYAPDRLAGLYVSNPNGVLLASAGRDLSVLGAAQVRSAGDAALSAGRDLSIASRVGDTTTTGFGKNRDTKQSLDVASVSAGGNLVLSGGRDVQLTAAQLEAGKSAAVVAGRDIVSTILTTTDISDRDINAGKTRTTSRTVDETLHGTTIRSDGDVALLARRDIALTAATVRSDAGAVVVSAVRDVNLLAGKESHSLVEDSTSKKKGFLNSTTTKTHTEVHDTNAIGTMLSGERVVIQAGRDVAGRGAQVVGTGDVVIAAGRDLTLDAAESTHSELFTVDKKKSGLMSGMGSGIGVTIGSRKQGQSSELKQTSAVGSVVGSLDGNVTLAAGHDLTVRGSDVISAAGIQIIGQNVTIASVEQTSDMTESSYFKQSGLNIAIGGGVVDSALGAYRAVKRGSEVKDDRLAGLYAAQAAYAAKDTAYGVKGIQSGTSSASGGVNVRITVGSQSSDSKTVVHEVTQRGSSLTSGGDIAIVATGDGQGNGGDLNIQGSAIEGQNVALAAARDLNISSSQNRYESESRSKSQGGEIGVAISADSGGGAAAGLYLSANASRGKGDGEGVSHNESQIKARDTLSFSSGRDTTLKGAQLAAETVIGDVGRNLTLTSEQDTDTYKNRSASVQGEMTIGYGFTGSASASASKIDSDYASVKEQTGIQAGAGGFDITVGEHTKLTGAAIASTATPDKNRLSTNSLSATDIQNKAEYSAMSVSLSTSGGQAGSAPAGSNVYSAPKSGGSMSPGMGVPQNEDSHNTTRSGISAGTVEVRNGDATALASIDRSVTALQQSGLKSIFDEQKVNEKMELGQIAGEVGFRAAGDLAQRMGWQEGSKEKVILHGVIGAGIAAMGGGDVLAGMSGAAANQLAFPAIKKALESEGIKEGTVEFNRYLQLASVAIGGVVAGSAGASTALAGELFNRQLHSFEIERIKDLANGDPKREAELLAAACALVKCSAQYTTGSAEQQFWATIETEGNKPEYQVDRDWLAAQAVAMSRNYMGHKWEEVHSLFSYTDADAMSDWSSRYQIGTRALGGLQMFGGALEAAGGLALVPTCETGIGCVAAAYLTFGGLDNARAGSKTMLSGKPASTWGGQALQGLGLSPNAAELIYGITQLAPAAVEAYAVNRLVNVEAAANAWVRGTYTGDNYSAFSDGVYRYTMPEYAGSTWSIYPGNVAQNHRYSPPGVGAVYAGTSAETAAAEVASYAALEGKVLVSQGVVVRNVLDLTDPAALKALGVTKEMLTNASHGGDSYALTHRLSAWARDQGYEAILAPSAQKVGGVNLISFRDLDKKGGKP